jgi:galactokinase
MLKQAGVAAWINYPQGVIAAMEDFGLEVPGGFDLAVESDLPAGAGLSSSAAIELASVLAFLALTGQEVERATAVKIARRAENDFVGVPCGILDQGVSGFGQVDHLVHIDCRGPRFETVPLPTGLHFWIFNTHAQHALVDGFYRKRHEECLAAAQALGVEQLADANMDTFHAGMEQLTRVQAKRARHVIEEIGRVEQTVAALRAGDCAEIGRLLTASHRSSQFFFDNSTPELDVLVDTVTRLPGVYGARLTGGGFGGAVMALTDGSFGEADADVVVEAYQKHWEASPEVLHLQTGSGAEVVMDS